MRQNIHRKIFYFTTLLLAFGMPVFPRILPLFILVMGLNWLASGWYLQTLPMLLKERWRILTLSLAGLYLMYLLGMTWSENLPYGWFDLQVKLSLLIFPVLFSLSDISFFTPRRMRIVFGSFVSGCIAGSLLLLGRSAFFHPAPPEDGVFYYTHLSWYFHPSYLSMYYVFAICILFYGFVKDQGRSSRVVKTGLILAMLFLEIMVFLLSSKAGLLSLFSVQAMFLVILLLVKAPVRHIAAALIFFVTAGGICSQVFPKAFDRLSEANAKVAQAAAGNTREEDSTLERLYIWNAAVRMIGQNFWYGTGTGDVKDVLIGAYSQDQSIHATINQRNAHNQFLQTFLALGLPGMLLLTWSLLMPAIAGLRKRQYMLHLFLVITILNLGVESMLETQAGVVFFAFFNALLFSVYSMDPSGDPFQVGGGQRRAGGQADAPTE